MRQLGVILSDCSPERNCLGLALETEEIINGIEGFSARLIDLQDFKTDAQSLREALRVDGLVVIAQESNFSYSDCLNKMLADTFPNLKQLNAAIIVNAEEQYWAENTANRLQDVLLRQELILFHKKLTVSKIEDTFNSSYQLTDNELRKKLIGFLEGYGDFVKTWKPRAETEYISELQ